MDTKLALACLLIAGGAVGLVLPAAEEDAREAGLAANSANGSVDMGEMQLATVREDSDAWSDELTLERERDGHFYADVTIDGATSRMLVDTGASVVALTGDDASAMGLYWDDSEIAPVAQGASGPVYGVNTQLPRVQLGELEAQGVRAIIVPEGLGVSLLGQSFLSQLGTVQIAGDRMVLGN